MTVPRPDSLAVALSLMALTSCAGPSPFRRDDGVAGEIDRYRQKAALVQISRHGRLAYDLAVFEDGAVLFEGSDCWFRPGVHARQLAKDEIAGVRQSLVAGSAGDAGRACPHGSSVTVRWRREGQPVQVRDRCADEGSSAAVELAERLSRQVAADGLRLATPCPDVAPEAADIRVHQGVVSRTVAW
jgi:hypothetical protein